MAKKHEYSMLSLWFGDNKMVIENQVSRLRAKIGFTVKHDGDAVSTPYEITLDMKMAISMLLQKALKTIVIDIQNKILRPKTHEKAKIWIRENDPISFEMAYPGRGTVVREMSMDEIMNKAKDDPEIRAEMIRRLTAMDDKE